MSQSVLDDRIGADVFRLLKGSHAMTLQAETLAAELEAAYHALDEAVASMPPESVPAFVDRHQGYAQWRAAKMGERP